eukprot:UN04628
MKRLFGDIYHLTWEPEKVTKCTWLGNQHKVLRRKAKSIATCVGSALI